jgi:hypothetical protein
MKVVSLLQYGRDDLSSYRKDISLVIRSRLFSLAGAAAAAAVVLPAGLAAVPAAASPGTGAAVAACTWRLDTHLPLPAGATSAVISATDGVADFGGYAYATGGAASAVVWRAGQPVKLATPVGWLTVVNGMNGRGDVVGLGSAPNGRDVGVLWHGGQLIELGTEPGFSAEALDINDAGLIVGSSWDPATGDRRGIVWSAADPGKFSYVTAPGIDVDLRSVTEDGTLAATYLDATFHTIPATGTVATGLHGLPLPAGTDNGSAVAASGAFLAGTAQNGAAAGHAVLWQNGVPKDLSKDRSTVVGVNSAGTVIGDDLVANQAVVWSGGTEQPLPTSITGPVTTSAQVGAITEAGAVGGRVVTTGGNQMPVVWHCR